MQARLTCLQRLSSAGIAFEASVRLAPKEIFFALSSSVQNSAKTISRTTYCLEVEPHLSQDRR
jgi:hypothetical protein